MLVITRVFGAPRELVWKAWTEPERIARWWGPKDFTAPAIKTDFRVGGRYHYCMHGPAGSPFDKDLWSTGVYEEIVPLQRIVATDSFADEQGNVVPASYYGMPGDLPMEFRITVTFEDDDGKTKLTLRHEGLPAGAMADGASAGWNESLDKLAASLKTTFTIKRDELKVIMERIFDAPREAVFKALTDPAAIPQWWGPRKYTTTVDRMDVRAGGEWRFIHRDEEGNEYAFHGVFKAIEPPRLISQTFVFEGIPGEHEVLDTLTLKDLGDGRTKVTAVSTFANVEDLDGMVGSGMESGAVESWDRLEDYLTAR
ncbi:MAG: SRPBCC domain-containing protein [bacterium]